MRLMKSAVVAATLLATVAGATAQSGDVIGKGIGTKAVVKQAREVSYPPARNYRDAYASAHNHRHKVPQSGFSNPSTPTLDNIHGGPAR